IVPVLEKIQGQVERADAIIQRLRKLIRKRSVDKTPCDIKALIADTIELLQLRMQKQNVAIVTIFEGEKRPLLADSVG
ncbi:sensor histidine kinase, partial [Vibrio parahaemolyticus]|nr:sensor histidine kinase [Vibrio parahaemolyticus]